MNVFAKFNEIPSMILQDIKEPNVTDTKTFQTHCQSDNVKTVYPPTNTVCGGYNKFKRVNPQAFRIFKKQISTSSDSLSDNSLSEGQ